MSIKTIPLRSIEEKVENMYEAVCIMSGQAKRILDERIVQASIKDFIKKVNQITKGVY